jgi:hypothetical protein
MADSWNLTENCLWKWLWINDDCGVAKSHLIKRKSIPKSRPEYPIEWWLNRWWFRLEFFSFWQFLAIYTKTITDYRKMIVDVLRIIAIFICGSSNSKINPTKMRRTTISKLWVFIANRASKRCSWLCPHYFKLICKWKPVFF